MGLFTLPPKVKQDALDLDSLFINKSESQIKRAKKMLLPEWYPQSVIQLTWPHSKTDWAVMLEEVEQCYIRIAYEIASRQPLLIVAPHDKELRLRLNERIPKRIMENIQIFHCETNDTWARDHGFLSVIDTEGLQLLDFKFNGWGGKFSADLDNTINKQLFDAKLLKGEYIDCLTTELEGGSIESNGNGDLLTTTTCLLNKNRGTERTRCQMKELLKNKFGTENILWLHRGGLEGDDTDAHIDTLARLCPNNKIIYVKCTDEKDSHFEELKAMEEELYSFSNSDGEPFELVAVPLPRAIYFQGERLPATYANYLVLNDAVLVPTYGQPDNDKCALKQIASVFDNKEIVGIDCNSLIKQHGSLHCATMQYPKGVYSKLQ